MGEGGISVRDESLGVIDVIVVRSMVAPAVNLGLSFSIRAYVSGGDHP